MQQENLSDLGDGVYSGVCVREQHTRYRSMSRGKAFGFVDSGRDHYVRSPY